MVDKNDKTHAPFEFIANLIDTGYGTEARKKGRRVYIFLPGKYVDDPRFPFKGDGPLMCRVEGNKLILLKMVPQE
jgi:hypothetical protein